MSDRRVKLWLVATVVVALTAFFGFILLAASMTTAGSTAIHTPDEAAVYEDNALGNASGHEVTRELQATNAMCLVPQPYVAECFEKTAVERERWVRRLADAVGNLEIDDDRVACSGVLLDSGGKTSMYFITAAACVPNEKKVDRARIHFTGCSGTTTYKNLKVYTMNRRLGYVILRIETNANDVRAAYGFLRLRRTKPAAGEHVWIAHYAKNKALKSLTTTLAHGPITIQAYEPISGCEVASPVSRVAYVAPLMDSLANGAPVISYVDGTVVAVHLCGDCAATRLSNGVAAATILVDLDNKAQEVDTFAKGALADDGLVRG